MGTAYLILIIHTRSFLRAFIHTKQIDIHFNDWKMKALWLFL